MQAQSQKPNNHMASHNQTVRMSSSSSEYFKELYKDFIGTDDYIKVFKTKEGKQAYMYEPQIREDDPPAELLIDAEAPFLKGQPKSVCSVSFVAILVTYCSIEAVLRKLLSSKNLLFTAFTFETH
ncbi:hypothetical protein ATANTOWER_022683 [Ataeniobius toweri]|uniref:Uncharacterized protein n=1 Tax=Ataeniobius toweri TaxID=208326 RepID=A0ABU7BBI7_9TELE|nr:hypothetical protein [Ataeniobius toweri]